MTLTEGLLIGIAVGVAVLLGIVVRALRWLRASANELRALVKYAGSSMRVTTTQPQVQRDQVHLVLMDGAEKDVHFVMTVDPAQRGQSVTYRGHAYTCASGSVDEGYFVYRQQR